MTYPLTLLVPILSSETASLFVSPTLVKPWVDRTTKSPTSALKLAVRMNLLQISTTSAMYADDRADPTDSVSAIGAVVENLFYKTKRGKVSKVRVGRREEMRFETLAGEIDKIFVNGIVFLNTRGTPATWLGKLWQRVYERFSSMDLVAAHVHGHIDTSDGAVEVYVDLPASAEIEVVGYTIEAYRTNYHRIVYGNAPKSLSGLRP